MSTNKNNIVEICTTFHKTWKEQQEEDRQRLENTYEEYTKKLQEMHKKTDDIYKNLFQWMIENTKHNESNEFISTLEEMIKDVNESPWKMDVYADVIKESMTMMHKKKNPQVVEDKHQYPYGKKPLYFDFMDI